MKGSLLQASSQIQSVADRAIANVAELQEALVEEIKQNPFDESGLDLYVFVEEASLFASLPLGRAPAVDRAQPKRRFEYDGAIRPGMGREWRSRG